MGRGWVLEAKLLVFTPTHVAIFVLLDKSFITQDKLSVSGKFCLSSDLPACLGFARFLPYEDSLCFSK